MEKFPTNHGESEPIRPTSDQESKEEKQYAQIPGHVFNTLIQDLQSQENTDKILQFSPGDQFPAAINSDESATYQVLDAMNGHYLLAKASPASSEEVASGGFHYFSAGESLGDVENPALIVCSEADLEGWMK